MLHKWIVLFFVIIIQPPDLNPIQDFNSWRQNTQFKQKHPQTAGEALQEEN